MAKTVVGLMDTRDEAEVVVRDLKDTCRCDRSDISLVVRGPDGQTLAPGTSEMASGALKGAGTGAAVGGIAGLIAGVSAVAVPGFGAVIAAGPIAAALAGAGVGAVAGGLIGGLTILGVPESEAHFYAEGVKRGGTLITVHARDDAAADCALNVMKRHGAVDIDERSTDWRTQGWAGQVTPDDYTLPTPEAEQAVGRRPSRSSSNARSYSFNRPMEESVAAQSEMQPVGQASLGATVSNYGGPDRRKAANQDYPGADRRRAA